MASGGRTATRPQRRRQHNEAKMSGWLEPLNDLHGTSWRRSRGNPMTRDNIFTCCTLLLFVVAILPQRSFAQKPDTVTSVDNLPSTPQPQPKQSSTGSRGSLETPVTLAASFPREAGTQMSSSAAPQAPPAAQTPSAPMHRTRTQAEQLALKNNPRISVGRLLALAQHQIYRETRAAELPTFNGAITAVEANEGTRIGAGSLTA